MRERGSAPIEFAAGVLLLLVPVLVLVLSFAPALERRVLARSLAADIASTLAIGEPSDWTRGLWLGRAGSDGVGPDDVLVEVCGSIGVPLERVGSCPGADPVTVTVIIRVDGLVETVRHTHRQPVPPYRSQA